jgi:hypothetical protein
MSKFEFMINPKTPQFLGLAVPPMLFARADKIIEQQRYLPRRELTRKNILLTSGVAVFKNRLSRDFRGCFRRLPNQSFVGRVYRRRPSASVITPAATTTITMTVASASAEARVS